jgi:hypothetical protein
MPDEVENPIAAAPITSPRWPAWVASVSAGVAVIVITSAWIWTAGRLVNCVDRETCNDNAQQSVEVYRAEADRHFAQHERRIDEAEKQSRESHGVLVELRTKVDLILQRIKD